MKIEQLKVLSNLRLKDKINDIEFTTKVSKDSIRKWSYEPEDFIDYFLEWISVYASLEEVEIIEAHNTLHLIYSRYGKEACRSVVNIIKKCNPYSLKEVVSYFLNPIIESDIAIWEHENEFCQLCQIADFRKNIFTMRTDINDIKDAYFQRVNALLSAKDKIRHDLLFDEKLIKEGPSLHYTAISWYNDLSSTIHNRNLPNKEKIFELVERMVHDVNLIRYFYLHTEDNLLILKFREEFLDEWCYKEIISNPTVFQHRSIEEMYQLASYYAEYKEKGIENIKPLLNHPILLRLPFKCQEQLIAKYGDLGEEDYGAFVKMIQFILVEFSSLGDEALISMLYYYILNPREDLDINSLLVRGWSIDALEKFLNTHNIQSFTGATSIKQYILKGKD